MKHWKDRDFDECCWPMAGVGNDTMVCAEACRGSYCAPHRIQLDLVYSYQPRASAAFQQSKKAGKGRKIVHPTRPVTAAMKRVIEDVAARHGISVEQLKTGGPGRRFAVPRQEACWALRQLGKSFPQVASAVGLADHTTAIHACRAHEARTQAAADEAHRVAA